MMEARVGIEPAPLIDRP